MNKLFIQLCPYEKHCECQDGREDMPPTATRMMHEFDSLSIIIKTIEIIE